MPVEAKRCIIEGQAVLTMERFYDEIARRLDFPDYFGRNLDALHDVLTTDIEGPVEFIWENSEISREAMKEDFLRVRDVLRSVAAERSDFVFTLA